MQLYIFIITHYVSQSHDYGVPAKILKLWKFEAFHDISCKVTMYSRTVSTSIEARFVQKNTEFSYGLYSKNVVKG